MTSPDGEDAVAAIAEVWEERYPIYLALVEPTAVEVTFRRLDPPGRELGTL